MAHTLCPWWLGYGLLSPIRRLREDPSEALSPFIRDGMIVLEPGPGMGFFTLEAARLVGPSGRVVAVDLQPRMLAVLARRAARAGLGDRIETRTARPETLGVADLAGKVNVVLALHVVHELPDAGVFFAEASDTLKPGGALLLAEPKGHVSEAEFGASVAAAERAGLRRGGGVAGVWGRTARFVKA